MVKLQKDSILLRAISVKIYHFLGVSTISIIYTDENSDDFRFIYHLMT